MKVRLASAQTWMYRGAAVLLAYVIVAQALFASIATGAHAGERHALLPSAMVLCSGESSPISDGEPAHDGVRDCLARCAAALQIPVPLVPGGSELTATAGDLAPIIKSLRAQLLHAPGPITAFAPRAPPSVLTFA